MITANKVLRMRGREARLQRLRQRLGSWCFGWSILVVACWCARWLVPVYGEQVTWQLLGVVGGVQSLLVLVLVGVTQREWSAGMRRRELELQFADEQGER